MRKESSSAGQNRKNKQKTQPTPQPEWRILSVDPGLAPYSQEITRRMDAYRSCRAGLLSVGGTLSDFANGALYFGIHRTESGWVVREWLPGADHVFLTGDFNNWDPVSHPLRWKENGVWEITLEGHDALRHGQHIKLRVNRGADTFERLPAYIFHVEPDPATHRFCGIVWAPEQPFAWTDENWLSAAVTRKGEAPLVYEAHIGMAQEYEGIGTYREFADRVLPRIRRLGYNTVQLMAIQEHPYYGSFGYQVTNFYAASSWYGQPDDLKYLINAAHGMGLRVILDVVHSHACPNPGEGLDAQDGTDEQYFLSGGEGWHPAWKTRLFNYGRQEVLHFLLSNLKFWLEEYHFDGFRFDGVTSMLYRDHGLGSAFTDYGMYFSTNTDYRAMVYLMLANELVHALRPDALTVAEDMSGMPGIALPIEDGGIGFDYRLAMGEPDHWIRMLKDRKDEDWDMGKLWYEMNAHRPGEKDIGYCESHDQALVGDKTLIFRMADAEMYTSMDRICHSPAIDRAIALHKMIRFLTISAGGCGYLNFMGNEFGHPEWIDFPREGNGWSHHYARRQWSLAENGYLKYSWLNDFDQAMVHLCRETGWMRQAMPEVIWVDQDKKILCFSRMDTIFIFNFHSDRSQEEFFVSLHALKPDSWRVTLTTDEKRFGGDGLISTDYVYHREKREGFGEGFGLYLPARTAVALRPA